MQGRLSWGPLSFSLRSATCGPFHLDLPHCSVVQNICRRQERDQTAELLEAMRPMRMIIPTLLAVLCGMRRGEIAALRWRS